MYIYVDVVQKHNCMFIHRYMYMYTSQHVLMLIMIIMNKTDFTCNYMKLYITYDRDSEIEKLYGVD